MANDYFKLNFPVSTDLQFKFWGSKHKCNRLKAIIAFSLDLHNANDNLGRFGYPFHFRTRALNAFGNYVNTPDFTGVEFSPYHDSALGRDLTYTEELDRVWSHSVPTPITVGTPFPATGTVGGDYSISWKGNKTPFNLKLVTGSTVVDDVTLNVNSYVFHTAGKAAGSYTATITDKNGASITSTIVLAAAPVNIPVAKTDISVVFAGTNGSGTATTTWTNANATVDISPKTGLSNGAIVTATITAKAGYKINNKDVETFTYTVTGLTVVTAKTYYLAFRKNPSTATTPEGAAPFAITDEGKQTLTLDLKDGTTDYPVLVGAYEHGTTTVVPSGTVSMTYSATGTAAAVSLTATNKYALDIKPVSVGQTVLKVHTATPQVADGELTIIIVDTRPTTKNATAYLPAAGYDVYIGGKNPAPPFKLIPADATGQTVEWSFITDMKKTGITIDKATGEMNIPAMTSDTPPVAQPDDNFDIKVVIKNADGSVVPVDSSDVEDQTMHCYHTPKVDTKTITTSAGGDNSIAVGATATIEIDPTSWDKESDWKYVLDGTNVDTSSFLTVEWKSLDPTVATVNPTTGVITGVKSGDTRIQAVVKWHGNVLWEGDAGDNTGSSAINVK